MARTEPRSPRAWTLQCRRGDPPATRPVARSLAHGGGAGGAVLLVVLAATLLAPAPARAAFPGKNGALAYHGRASSKGVLDLRRPSGKRLRRLRITGRLSEPQFSPLGRRIAFTNRGAIWVAGVDGSDPRRVTPPGLRARNPTWSPDGGSLAFAGGRAGRRDIYRIGLDGHGLARVTFSRADETEPAWSRRNLIAFVRETRRGDGNLFAIAPIGNPPRRVTRGRGDDRSPEWSPGGTRIAYRRGRPGHRQLFVIRPNGKGRRRLTKLRRGITGPAWSPNGRRIAFGVGRRGHRALAVVRTNGRKLHRIVRGSADVRSVAWQPRGAYPVIAAAGDVACDPTARSFAGGLGTASSCHMRQTSDLLLEMDLWAVLVLGDAQYSDGQLWKYQRSFDLTWGRVKSLIRPVLGNHEYGVPGAAGHFDYFNGAGRADGPAGPRGAGYYSFDVGSWHIVALNSQCSHHPDPPGVPACGAGSAQERWLRADLAAHPSACTLAYWHHPLISSRLGLDADERALWQALIDAGVDVVLTGHDHGYERFLPLNASGSVDAEHGIRQFVVGTGGKSHHRADAISPESEVRNSDTYGVLRMQLRPTSYHWQFVPEADGEFTDAGARSCH